MLLKPPKCCLRPLGREIAESSLAKIAHRINDDASPSPLLVVQRRNCSDVLSIRINQGVRLANCTKDTKIYKSAALAEQMKTSK